MGQEEAGDDDGGDVKTDLRSEWLKTRVLTTLKVKAEKWAEMDEESLFPIKDFLDTGTQCLFITLGERDKICASVSAPSGARKKSCFFLKLEEEKLKTDPEEFNKQFISGDFSKSPLEQLLPLAQDIYLPILVARPPCAQHSCRLCSPHHCPASTIAVPLARGEGQSIGDGGGWALHRGVDIVEPSQPSAGY